MTKKQLLAMKQLETDKQLTRAITCLDKYLCRDLSLLNSQENKELEQISDLIYEYEERTNILHRCLQHKQKKLQVGSQCALIDESITSLIKAIWEKEIYTSNSCQENKPGIVWIEFQTAWDAAAFMNIVGKFPKSDIEQSMYGRITNLGWGGDWEFDCNLENIGNSKKVDFNFFMSVRFPKTDVPEIMERLNESKGHTRS